MAFLFLLLRLDAISDLAHPELPDLIQLDEKPAVLPRRLYGIIQKIGKNRGKIDLLDIRKVDVSHPDGHRDALCLRLPDFLIQNDVEHLIFCVALLSQHI